MPYRCVVLAKQVPDTKRITGQAMNEDGTVNRAALPAIFNPEDLNALELALSIRDEHGGEVVIMTMGPPAACDLLREGLYRGADRAILISDRRAAASDTLATSYILSCAVRKLGGYDLVICGRQAIDGDTAQVGPQLAEKLNLPQITYVQELVRLRGRRIRVRRDVGEGWELLESRLPVLLTVMGNANTPRPPAAKRMMKYKRARSPLELVSQLQQQGLEGEQLRQRLAEQTAQLESQGLLITHWNLDDVEADLAWCGRDGSPTKVHRIQSVVLKASGFKNIDPTDEGIRQLVHELIEDHTIG